MRTRIDWIAITVVAVMAVTLFLVLDKNARAGEISDDQAHRAIIGEDSSSYEAMYAVAHAIRNRGSLKGVYGLNAVKWDGGLLKRYRKSEVTEIIDAKTYQMAQKAWAESEDGLDPTNGSTHWEGVKFKSPYWQSDFSYSIVIGGNRFYYNEVKK